MMNGDSIQTEVERIYTLLYWQLASTMPRPTGGNEPHPYSKGAMVAGFLCERINNGYKIVMSANVDYSAFAMGYDTSGNRRTARGQHEALNFKTVPNAIEMIKKITGAKEI